MKKIILLFVLFTGLILSLKAQNDCETMVRDANNYYKKKQYNEALKIIQEIENDCPEYFIDVKDIKTQCEKEISKKDAFLTLSKAKIEIPVSGGTESITINANVSWSFGKHPDWINLSRSGNSLIIECDPNRTSEDRNATITISGNNGSITKNFKVLQEKGQLSVSNDNINFVSRGGNITVFVESNMDWIIDSQYNSWIKTSQSGNAITVSCGENTSVDKKKGSFTIRTSNGDYKRITVEQDGAKVFLDIPQRLNYSGNGGKTSITIKTNASDWYVSNVGTLSWCKASKRGDKELYIEVQSNPITSPRNTYVRICAKNVYKDITITQDAKGGYAGLLDDYFDYVDGTRKISFFEINLYAFGNYGVRMSSMMYRWKFAEIDFLNMNFGIAPQLSIDWEPMVRGYLPFTSDGRCWAAYIGLGGRVNLYESSWDYETYIDNSSSIVFETGVEYHWERSDNTSTRLFIRYDGAISLGIAFDMYKWNY